jgi:GNAT superfamily N-acetyltransferase
VSSTTAHGVECHPLSASDVEAAVAIFVSTSHHEVTSDAQSRLAETIDHLLAHDPEGCWLATVSDIPSGFAAAIRRDELWLLPALFVAPEYQTRGVGRALMERAMAHAGDAPRGVITSSGDPRATHLYGSLGFTAHPTLYAAGRPDRTALPAGLAAREASLDDLELMRDVDSRVRGSVRTQDLEFLLEQDARGHVKDSGSSRGYVLFRNGDPPIDGVPLMLAATDLDTARSLLWQTLAEATSDVLVPALTPSRQWAFEVTLSARLRLMPGGPFFSRGTADLPGPWIPSGFFG